MNDLHAEPIATKDYGLCECGCGIKTKTTRRGDAQYGYVKGAPRRFVHNHHGRLVADLDSPIIVDEVDRDLLTFGWTIFQNGETRYASRGISKKTNAVHRIIASRMLDRTFVSGEVVDHKSGNALDNRRCNLRVVTVAENNANRTRHHRRNTSGFRGVSQRESGRWRAYANVYGKRHHLGRYATAQEASDVAHAWRLANMPGYLGLPAEISQ